MDGCWLVLFLEYSPWPSLIVREGYLVPPGTMLVTTALHIHHVSSSYLFAPLSLLRNEIISCFKLFVQKLFVVCYWKMVLVYHIDIRANSSNIVHCWVWFQDKKNPKKIATWDSLELCCNICLTTFWLTLVCSLLHARRLKCRLRNAPSLAEAIRIISCSTAI